MVESLVNEKNKVSIVVPIYNTKKFLRRCIESILKQSYENIQVILIDDGSTDGSSNICDEYAQKDDRVICIHKQNGGVSSARNLGLENVSGDFVCFIDSDDFVELDYIKILVKEIKEYDVVVAGTKTVDMHGNLLRVNRPEKNEFIGNNNIKNEYINKTIKHLFFGPVAKLYRVNLIKDIKFDTDLVVGEDIVFNLNFLRGAESVKIVDYLGYIVEKNVKSTTHNIELKYTPLYEHDYCVIKNSIRKAKEKWNFDKKFLDEEEERAAVMRYYHEITNLFRPGTPYNTKEVLLKIQNIHNDKQFIKNIKQQNYGILSRPEKFAYISAKIKISFLTYILFKLLLKLRKGI